MRFRWFAQNLCDECEWESSLARLALPSSAQLTTGIPNNNNSSDINIVCYYTRFDGSIARHTNVDAHKSICYNDTHTRTQIFHKNLFRSQSKDILVFLGRKTLRDCENGMLVYVSGADDKRECVNRFEVLLNAKSKWPARKYFFQTKALRGTGKFFEYVASIAYSEQLVSIDQKFKIYFSRISNPLHKWNCVVCYLSKLILNPSRP